VVDKVFPVGRAAAADLIPATQDKVCPDGKAAAAADRVPVIADIVQPVGRDKACPVGRAAAVVRVPEMVDKVYLDGKTVAVEPTPAVAVAQPAFQVGKPEVVVEAVEPRLVTFYSKNSLWAALNFKVVSNAIEPSTMAAIPWAVAWLLTRTQWAARWQVWVETK
jgi:hypothetical protein